MFLLSKWRTKANGPAPEERASAGAATEEQVREALATVTDFDHGADVVSLGMISGIAIDDNGVTFTLKVDPEEAGLKEPLRQACELDFQCLTIEDACASADPVAHQGAIHMVTVEDGIFGVVSDAGAVVAGLAGAAP